MNDLLTYGATRDRLIANGYAPTSALSPYGAICGSMGARLKSLGYRIADDPAAILCRATPECCSLQDFGKRRVVSLIVTAHDKALRAAIASKIEKLGLARGPVRMRSDGAEHRPRGFEDYEAVVTRNWSPFEAPPDDEPAVIVEQADPFALGQPLVSALVRLDGTWRGGDLLTTPRAKLPAIDREGIAKLFSELSAIPTGTRSAA